MTTVACKKCEWSDPHMKGIYAGDMLDYVACRNDSCDNISGATDLGKEHAVKLWNEDNNVQ